MKSKASQPQFPAYLGPVTTEQVEAAKCKYEADRRTPLFMHTAGHRRAALQAKMNSGMYIPLDLWVEYGDLVPDGYRPTIDRAAPKLGVSERKAIDPQQAERDAEARVREFDNGAMRTFMQSSPHFMATLEFGGK